MSVSRALHRGVRTSATVSISVPLRICQARVWLRPTKTFQTLVHHNQRVTCRSEQLNRPCNTRLISDESPVLSAQSKDGLRRGSLTGELLQLIKMRGPITVAEYMKLCLTHPAHGYYMKQDVFGSSGDFVTAPEVSQLFGEMIGIWCVLLWQQMKCPTSFELLELGPGRGTLMKDILRSTRVFPDFQKALHVTMCEASPTMQRLQYANLVGEPVKNPDTLPSSDLSDPVCSSPELGNVPIAWKQHFLNHLVAVNKPSITLGQEFIDALPVHQFEFTPEYGWCERLVDYTPGRRSDEELRFVLSPGPTNAARTFKPFLPPELSRGSTIEICPQGLALAEIVSKNIQKFGGGALFIDYGSNTRTSLTLQGIRGHEFVDILDSPGDIDLSAYVDFKALSDMVSQAGATSPENQKACTFPVISQGDFLAGMGIRERVQLLCQNASEEQQETLISGYTRLCSPDEMGERYKVLGISRTDQGVLAPFIQPQQSP